MTIPEQMIAHSTHAEFQHRHRQDQLDADLPHPQRTRPAAPLRTVRKRASAFLRAVAAYIEPGPASTPGAHRA